MIIYWTAKVGTDWVVFAHNERYDTTRWIKTFKTRKGADNYCLKMMNNLTGRQ